MKNKLATMRDIIGIIIGIAGLISSFFFVPQYFSCIAQGSHIEANNANFDITGGWVVIQGVGGNCTIQINGVSTPSFFNTNLIPIMMVVTSLSVILIVFLILNLYKEYFKKEKTPITS